MNKWFGTKPGFRFRLCPEFINSEIKLIWNWQHIFSSIRDVRHFKDVRKEFERSSETLEGALARNAQAPRAKQHEVEEANNALLNARRIFRSEALDYVLEVSFSTLSFTLNKVKVPGD